MGASYEPNHEFVRKQLLPKYSADQNQSSSTKNLAFQLDCRRSQPNGSSDLARKVAHEEFDATKRVEPGDKEGFAIYKRRNSAVEGRTEESKELAQDVQK